MNFFIGLATGIFGGLVGLGGGVVMIPLMVSVLKMEQHKAHGTSLVALIFTGIAGMVIYQKNGSVELWAAVILAISAIFTARIGTGYAIAMPDWKLKRVFGGLLCFVAVLLLLRSLSLPVMLSPSEAARIFILLATGAVTGFLSGMLGVGGGSVMVPAMVIFAGFNQHAAQGTSLLAMIPIGMAGAYTHWRFGQVNTKVLPLLIPAIIIGAPIGGYLAHSLPELALRLVFAAVLFWMGLKYIRTVKPADCSESENR